MGMLTHRRYRARLAAQAITDGKRAVAGVHKANAESQAAGTLLPDDFPGKTELAEATPAAILSYEDLYGASKSELTAIDGIGPKTAQRILDAVTAWEES